VHSISAAALLVADTAVVVVAVDGVEIVSWQLVCMVVVVVVAFVVVLEGSCSV